MSLGEVRGVCEDVYAYLQPDGSWYLNNTGFLVSDGSRVISVDATSTERRTRAYLDAIKAVTEKPVRTLVNTHHHGDHTHGNYLMSGATIIGHERCREAVLNTPMPPPPGIWSGGGLGDLEPGLAAVPDLHRRRHPVVRQPALRGPLRRHRGAYHERLPCSRRDGGLHRRPALTCHALKYDMAWANEEIAGLLREYADLTQITGGDVFRAGTMRRPPVRSRLGRRISQLDVKALRDSRRGRLDRGKIAEYRETGRIGALEELRATIPHGVRELTRVPGLGPKRALQLNQELGVASVEDLAEAISGQAGRPGGIRGQERGDACGPASRCRSRPEGECR